MSTEYLILTLVRLILPLSIIRWPLFGILLAAFLDYRDWDFLGVSSDREMIFYQNWDKFMDIYYLALAWFVSLKWEDKIARTTGSILFFWRSLGVPAAFFIDRSLLIFFPNVFEWFFIFYLLFVFLKKRQVLFTSGKILIIVLLSITIPKLAQEYFMHVIRRFPWDIFNPYKELGFDKFLPNVINWPQWLWVVAFGLLPILTLIWVIKFAPKKMESKIINL